MSEIDNNILFDAVGFYEPGFIHLRVNTEEDLSDLNKLKDKPDTLKYYSNFFHEYVHFLQDITTSYGLINGVFMIDYIKELNLTVRNDGSPTFKTPLKPSNSNNILVNISLKKISYGSSEPFTRVLYSHYDNVSEKVVTNLGEELQMPKYRVYVTDTITRNPERIHFGAVHLKEYMAHALQKLLFPFTEHNDVPYVLPELIVKKELPNLGEEPQLFIALCDAALMSYHPTQIFFNTIERLKKEKELPKTVEEIYRFTYQVEFTFHDQVESIYSLFQKMILLNKAQFQDAFKSDLFKNNYLWIAEVLEAAEKLRLNHISFFPNIIESEGKLSAEYFKIFDMVGTPFMTNKLGKGWFNPPKKQEGMTIQPFFPSVFKEVLKIYSGVKKCSLYDFCKSREDIDITNDKCLTAPWLRSKEGELCPVGQIWKTWGLENEIPI